MRITVHDRAAGERSPRPTAARPAGRLLVDRRRFMEGGLAATGAYAVSHAGLTWLVGAGRAWAAEFQVFDPALAETLLQMSRALYPHDFLGDVHYARVVQDLDAEAADPDNQERLAMFRAGMGELDAAAGGSFTRADAAGRQAALQKIAGGPFFEAVRSKTIVSLYGRPEVWEQFGYEGPSFERGGYLDHGFDDLSWLPAPPADASPPVAR
jgi:hypothetical protein